MKDANLHVVLWRLLAAIACLGAWFLARQWLYHTQPSSDFVFFSVWIARQTLLGGGIGALFGRRGFVIGLAVGFLLGANWVWMFTHAGWET
jgi:hypothetical protein